MSKIKFIHAIYLEEINFGKIEKGKMKKINRDRKSEIKEQKGEEGELSGEWEDFMVSSDDDDDSDSMYDELGEMASVNDLTKAGMLDDDDDEMGADIGFDDEDLSFGDEEFSEEAEELEEGDEGFEEDFDDDDFDDDFDDEDDVDDFDDDDDDEEDDDYDDDEE